MIVVCDANILVRAAWSLAGPAAEVIARLAVSPHRLVCSHVLLAEVDRTLKAPRLRQRHQLHDAAIERFIRSIESLADIVVVPVGRPPVVVGDPMDDHVVFTAEEHRADVICTRDRHLFHPDVLAYCSQRRIRILTDLDLLTELRH